MASTYSTNLKIQLMTTGENTGTWGNVTNVNLGTALEEAIGGNATITFNSADVNLNDSQYWDDTNSSLPARNMRLVLSGTSGGARQLIVPDNIEKLYVIRNALADTVTVRTTSGSGVAIPTLKTMWVYSDAINVVDVTTYLSSLTLGTPLPVSSGGTGSNTGVNVQSVSGVLPVANGGTGSATAAFNGSLITNLNATAITSGTIANSYTTANTANQSNAIVARDTGGNFAANTITANLVGNVTGNVTGNVIGNADTATKLSGTSGSAPSYGVRAWVSISGSTTIDASGNVSSVGDLGAGAYQVNFTTAMPSNYYGIGTTGEGYTGGINGALQGPTVYNISSSSFSMVGASNTNSRGSDWLTVQAIVAC